jgi:arylsulfatase A-like enzyme
MKTVNYKLMQYFILSLSFITIFLSEAVALTPDNLQDNDSTNSFNIVLITIDTLRADHLSCYGYERKTSPNIDKIAQNGFIFKNAMAPSSWTAPSVASLCTSLYPISHGMVHGIADTINNQEILSNNITTLAEILKARGYRTFGVVSNSHLDKKFGFGRGFDYFKCLPFLPASFVHETIDSWADTIRKSDKYFLWVHYFDPHWPYWPYQPREPWLDKYLAEMQDSDMDYKRSLIKKILSGKHHAVAPLLTQNHPRALFLLKALYDSEINHVDSYVGTLIEKFNLNTNTLIIITSDHGDEFLEHGSIGHGNNLYWETIHIPLIIKLPEGANGKITEQPVNLVDIMPSILYIIGIAPPEQSVGSSVFTRNELKKFSLRDEKSPYSFAELDLKNSLKTIITPEWKYIYDYHKKVEQLYNLTTDPFEQKDMSKQNSTVTRKLRE